jgi:(p)ppGpp synthase/HD superfamily hydrolase
MPWDCKAGRHQKHAIQQDERTKHLEQELNAARLEITKLKAAIGSNNIVKQAEVNDWMKPKNSKAERKKERKREERKKERKRKKEPVYKSGLCNRASPFLH